MTTLSRRPPSQHRSRRGATRWVVATLAAASLVIAACGNGDDGLGTPPADLPAETAPQPDAPEVAEPGQPDDLDRVDDFVPSQPVPSGLPVYPGAVLWSELPGDETSWTWLYQTTGSANEIIDFFVAALQDLGFGIDADFTFAIFEEFFVATDDDVVRVFWLGDDIADEITPDTPNRGYGIIVDLEAWASR